MFKGTNSYSLYLFSLQKVQIKLCGKFRNPENQKNIMYLNSIDLLLGPFYVLASYYKDFRQMHPDTFIVWEHIFLQFISL